MCQQDEIKRLREENRSLREVVSQFHQPGEEDEEATLDYKETITQAHGLLRRLEIGEQNQALLDLRHLFYQDMGVCFL